MRQSLILLLTFLTLSVLPALAQSKSKQVRKLEQERKEALKAIEKTDKELRNTKKDKQNKQKHLNLLSKQVKQRTQMLSLLDKELKGIQIELDSITGLSSSLLQQEEKHKLTYANSLQAMQKRKRTLDRFLFVSSSKSFDEGFRRMRFMNQYADAFRKAAHNLNATRSEIEKQRLAVQTVKGEKDKLVQLRQSEKKKLEHEAAVHQDAVKQLGSKEKTLAQQLKKQKSRAEALNRRIEQQIAKEIAEAERKAREERERLARQAKKEGKPIPKQQERKAESAGGYAMTAAERTLSGSFAQNKGRLPAPVTSNYRIARGFGVHTHSSQSRVTVNNGGIDLAVKSGTDAKAVFDGVVSSVFAIPGYNTAVMVRHGNYITVYANLSQVYVSRGTKVKINQRLGKIFTDPDTKEAILHFELWKERNKQNPKSWIK